MVTKTTMVQNVNNKVGKGTQVLSDTLFALQVIFINGIIFSVIFWITDVAGRGSYPQATPCLLVSLVGLAISAFFNNSVDKKLYSDFNLDF